MTFYDILGVKSNATQEEIRAAYLAQIKYFHPDVFPGNPEIAKVKTVQLNEAYSVLSDSEKRRQYDAYVNAVAAARAASAAQRRPSPAREAEQHRDPTDADEKPESHAAAIFAILAVAGLTIFLLFSIGIANSRKNAEAGFAPSSSSASMSTAQDNSQKTWQHNPSSPSKPAASFEDSFAPNSLVSNIAGSVSAPQSDAEPAKEEEVTPALPLPENGQIVYTNGEAGVAPLEIVTTGSSNYLIKLKKRYIGSDVMSFFVRGGSTVEVDVPLGTYDLYYATGQNWYGEEALFGEKTRYYKATEPFEFYEEDGYVNGWTVELFLQQNGNLETDTIDPEEFS